MKSSGGWTGAKGFRTAGIGVKEDEQILGDSDFVKNVLESAEEALEEKKVRALLCFWAHRRLGMSTIEIARRLKMSQSAASVHRRVVNKSRKNIGSS